MVYENRQSSSMERKAQKTAAGASRRLAPAYTKKDIDTSILQTLKYEYPKRKITVESTTDEFTCICPYSGLPDFAKLTIKYVPRRKLIELKSLKYYLYAFRQVKIFNEHAINKILQDLQKALKPYEITVIGEFTSRGGIKNKVTANYKK